MALNLTRLGQRGLTALPAFRKTLPATSHQTIRSISSTIANRNVFDSKLAYLEKGVLEYKNEVHRQLAHEVNELTRQNQELTTRISELTGRQDDSTRPATEITTEDRKSTLCRDMLIEVMGDILLILKNPSTYNLQAELLEDKEAEEGDGKQEKRYGVSLRYTKDAGVQRHIETLK